MTSPNVDPLFRVRVRTTPTTPAWDAAVGGAWLSTFAQPISRAARSVGWAQWALETARGQACWNWNLGNERAVDGRPYTLLPGAWECGQALPAGAIEIPPPPGAVCGPGERVYLLLAHTQRFAAFDTLADGAHAYVRRLSRASYTRALRAMLSGDAHAFAHALKSLGYYTAPAEQYARGLVSLAAEYLRAVPDVAIVVPPPVPASGETTWPDTPAAIRREPMPVAGGASAATPLRAGAGVHSVELADGGAVLTWAPELDELAQSLVCSTCWDPGELSTA